ncbi:MAG: ATP-binding protein [Cyanobacteria bacterium]|nr:ATP-binding protein [Cyanobacteria bacterium CG_2015-16_32_12]NCO76774.1 ATP-binding protein [Cyanobacteria bacterium CG_2015-22_32_23]NCQ03908.1 ATP-binding protein [Cyanobacteria bacterium CG_2015-09_32_10]NCQ40818.1 ATP-binding protein [Cyanobacteria bacterium CG_2015-04_32_10]NCS85288.1 ATP-binding protein [Cyanobacteria bacterium CG_2015-02_32_10]
MSTLEIFFRDLLEKKEVIINPFDDITFGNFWYEKPVTEDVNSIHHDAIIQTEKQLKLLKKDALHLTKTLLLIGDAGCGKSNLLGRLKKQLNDEAFFVYIQPIEDYNYFWRHTLQYTIASLMQIPEGETDSQLRLWLKGLPVFENQNLWQKILGEKKTFISHLKKSYPAGIFENKKFFGILYELAKDNYDLACEWLAGEDLDEEDLGILGVNKSIDSEKFARGILNNFGRIADATKPIILCFDQIERAFSSVFNFNTTFHNERLVNFLIIISAVRDNWQTFKKTMIQSELARINQTITLEDITIEEAEKLWINRLKPLHLQCNLKLDSDIAPLHKQILIDNAPGDHINLREALNLGGGKFQEYIDSIIVTPPSNFFLDIWKKTFTENQEKINSLIQFSDEEFIEMLKYCLSCLSVENINSKFLSGVTKTKSFSYEYPNLKEKIGIIWSNNRNGKSFYTLMEASEFAIRNNLCEKLIFIRSAGVGTKGTQAFDLYNKLFKPLSDKYKHYKPTIEDLQYLKTYHKLAKDALAGELIIEFKTVTLPELNQLMRDYQILNNCNLLVNLKLVKFTPDLGILKQTIVSIIKDKSIMKIQDLYLEVNNILTNYFIPKYYCNSAIYSLCKTTSFIKIKNPKDAPDNYILEYKI